MILKRKRLLFYYFKNFFAIFGLLAVVLIFCTYYFGYKTTLSEIDNNTKNTYLNATVIVENAVAECDRVHNSLISNNNLAQVLYSDHAMLEKKDFFDMLETAKNTLLSNSLSSLYIKNIALISPKNNLLISSGQFVPSTMDNFQSLDGFKNFFKTEKDYFIGNISLSTSGSSQLLLCKRINNAPDSGFVIFEINKETLYENLTDTISQDNMFYIFNDKVLINSNKTNNLSVKDLKDLQNTISNEANEYKNDSKTYNVFNFKINEYDLNMLIFLDNSTYGNIVTKMLLIFIFTALFSLLSCVWVSYIFSKNAMNPVSEIIKMIDSPQNTNLNLKINKMEELEYIMKNIIKSNEEKEIYKGQLEKKLKELDESQEIALTNQIHPHFLFNTLETIYATAFDFTKSENAVTKMIGMLSDLLHISLRVDSKFISIKEELSHVKNYLNLQAIRYSDLFEVVWDIDENLLDYSTIKLILQPICENAIYHGIKNVNHFCYIKISLTENKEKNTIIFSIENNGKPVEKTILLQLKKSLREHDYSTAHIGLKNTNKRIKIAFGEKYGCDISSDNEKTVATLTIPKVKIL